MKRKLAILFAVVMLVSCCACLTTACDKNEDSGTTLKLMIYSPATNAEKDVYKAMLDGFTAETGIKVNPTYIPKDQYNTKLKTTFKSNKQPDVFFLDQPTLADNAQYCLDLTTGFFAKEGETGLHLNDFYQVAIDTVMYDGKVLAVPFSLTSSIVLYNKKLVSKVPADWAEWKNMTVADGTALFGGVGSGGYASWYFQAFLKSAGGDMIDSSNNVIFNNEQGVKAANMLKALYDESPKSIRESSNAFVNGNVMFVLAHNSDIINYYSSNPSFFEDDLGATLFIPETAGATSYSNIGGENFAIYKESEHAEEAKLLVKYLLREENIDKAISTNFSAIKAYAKVRTNDPVTGTQYPQVVQDALGVVLRQLETASARPVVKNWIQVNDNYLAEALSAILEGRKGVEDALNTAQQQATNILEFN